jgi:hypothetical protein
MVSILERGREYLLDATVRPVFFLMNKIPQPEAGIRRFRPGAIGNFQQVCKIEQK